MDVSPDEPIITYATVSRFAADWGNIIGSLIQTAVVLAGGAWTYRRFLEDRRARLTDFHVILRKVDKPTASDDPIDSPGYWVVFANGTGLPVSRWRIYIQDDSPKRREYELSSERFGPVLPTSARPMALPVPVDDLESGVGLRVIRWGFRSGSKFWSSHGNGAKQVAPDPIDIAP